MNKNTLYTQHPNTRGEVNPFLQAMKHLELEMVFDLREEGVVHLHSKSLLRLHKILRGTIKSNPFWILEAVPLLGDDVMLERLNPVFHNRANCTH